MTPESFAFLSDLVKGRSGLALTADRLGFVESRLQPVAWRRGFRNASELVGELKSQRDPALLRETVAAMSTHDSAFFRDDAPFAAFRSVMIPALLKARFGKRELRIWSAGASTGQEAYSLAMILEETPGLKGWNASILATDWDAGVLARAQEGIFNAFEVQRGLPLPMLAKHFRPHRRGWQISQAVRDRVQFRVVNLLDPIEALGTFDVIFCRNVLIYFDATTKETVATRLLCALGDDGYLVLGAAETVLGASRTLLPLAEYAGSYRKHLRTRTPSSALA